MRKRTALAVSVAIALWTVAADRAEAFTMEPMVATLSPTGTKSIATFRFKNDGTEPIALRVKMVTRAMNEDGSEANEAADALFDVFPSRFVVEPGDGAVVKVRWKGSASIKEELPFRFVAEQVPVDFAAEQQPGIRVMFRYIASLYIGEAKHVPEISAAVSQGTGPAGENGFLVVVANKGKKHVVVEDLRVEVTSGGTRLKEFTTDDLGALSSVNYLPGTSRKLFVPAPEAAAGRKYDAKVYFEAYD